MRNRTLLLLIPILTLGIFIGLSAVTRPAFAAGTVCFNDPSSFSTTAPCAPAGTALNAPAPDAAKNNAIPAGNVEGPRQIRIGVYLSGGDLINGFDITVLTNRTVLRPTGIDLTGTILAAPISNTVLCIDGALVSGPTCLLTDIPGTIHLAESGASGQLSTASTGLLFTLIYNVTGRTPARGQIVTFQTGCGSPTSPTSDPPICVTITNGGSGPVAETISSVRFNNSVDPNWVAISTPSPTTYTFNFGTPSPIVKFNATAEASFPGIVGSPAVTFTSIPSTGLTVSFTGAITACNAGPTPTTCGVSASFSASVGGTYFATIIGNYVSPNDTTLAPGGTLAGTVNIVINIVDIAWTVNGVSEYNPTNSQTLYMAPGVGNPMQVPFVVTSLGGFTGMITYANSALTGTTGLAFVFPPTFSLSAGQTRTFLINGTATTKGSANWVPRITLTGSISTFHSSALLTVKVSAFSLASNSTSVSFSPTVGKAHVEITGTSLGSPPATNGFAGPLAVSSPFTGPAGGILAFSFSPGSTITLTAGGSANTNVTISGTSSGTYTVTFTGTGGTNKDMTNSTIVTVTITGGKNSPTLTTAVSSTSVVVGQTAFDSSTLTGATVTAGGTVTYLLYLNGLCTAPSSIVSVVTVSGGTVPNSRPVLFNATGTYSFNATYSGDTGNNPANNHSCEPLTVIKATPTISTMINPSSTITVGASVTDHATLTGGFPSTGVTGSVIYAFFNNGSCTGTPTSTSTVTVGAGNSVPASSSVTPSATGSFGFNATYEGDANNNRVSSSCEALTVGKAIPTLTTSISPSSMVTLGTAVSDHATLTGGFPSTGVSGTVSYFFFTGGTCTGTAAAEGTITVGAGNSVPASNSVTPSPAGPYSFNATYSGDSNNNRVSSACEPLTVQNLPVPTLSTTIKNAAGATVTSIVVGNAVHDSATISGGSGTMTGTVTYTLFSNGSCIGTGSIVSALMIGGGNAVPDSASVTPSPVGTFSFQASYGGDANNGSTSSTCEPLTVTKTTPSITTTINPSATITVGSSVTDQATLSGGFPSTGVTGSVTYAFFSNGSCSGTPTSTSTVTVSTSNSVPASSSVTPASAGSFAFNATYSGDANNNRVSSTCEPLTVNKATPSLTTNITPSSTVTQGTAVTDHATINGGFPSTGVTGTVSYFFFTGGTCSGTATSEGTVTVGVGNSVPASNSVTPASTGSFSFNATYSGDGNNNRVSSACEALTVSAGLVVGTTINPSSTITVGASVTDQATLTGGVPSTGVTGTVSYFLFGTGNCTGTATLEGTVTIGASNSVGPSNSVTPASAGSFSFNATYSGDANNPRTSSACEPLTVNKASPTITTTLSSNSVRVGQTVTDSATLASFFQAGGTVTYGLFSNGSCTTPGIAGLIVTVANGVVPNTRPIQFNATGPYSFQAGYSGDANNNPILSACEPFMVTAGVSISTTVSTTTPIVGTTVTDSATLSGQSATAGGTVTYTDFANSQCTSPGIVVSIVSVTNGVVPNSRAVVTNSTGSLSFQASYSGDANNNAVTSACEPLTVSKASPTISTTLSATSIAIGASVTDSSTLASFFQAGGTVTYNEFTGGTCTGTATIVSTVTVTSGVVPNSGTITPISAGTFSFDAKYSGDNNNNQATSQCEPLTVRGQESLTTTLSTTSPVVGTTVTDSATLAGVTLNAGGTVTYSDFANGNCLAPGTTVSVVSVTNGSVPNSRAVPLNITGSLSFTAVYSGDANNAGVTSPCEPLTVVKTSPSIMTNLSATAITVGQSVTDSAALTGTFQASGTVSYNLFAGSGSCTGTSSAVSIVTVTNSVVPNSRSVTFNATNLGGNSFQAIYSGDSNNNGATSNCEPLTVTSISLHATQTNIVCMPGSVVINTPSTCTARVIDTSTSPTVPTGTVSFITNSTGTFSSTTCTLATGMAPTMATCSVTYTPTVAGHHLITGSYSGDSTHQSSNGNFTLNARSPPRGKSVLLTFSGFDVDDFENGIGQLRVLVNGQLVADIPSGVNGLTGSGDFRPYDDQWVIFGPFNITNFIVNGQNVIFFMDPQTSDHFGLIRNVTIVQGDPILLQVLRIRGIYPGFSVSYTFSNAPLAITSFTASIVSVSVDQGVTFTATLSGGTSPFACFFRFGDGGSGFVLASGSSCSAIHHFDSAGSFLVTVVVKGASTSDLVFAQMTITVR